MSQIRHPNPSLAGLGKVHQDLVFAQSDTERSPQIAVKGLRQELVHRQPGTPLLLFGGGQPLRHRYDS